MLSFEGMPVDLQRMGGCFKTARRVDPERMSPRSDRDTGELKLVEGKPVYSVPVLWVDDDSTDGNVYLYVFNRPENVINNDTIVQPVGEVRVVREWSMRDSNAIGRSFVCDSIAASPAVPRMMGGLDD